MTPFFSPSNKWVLTYLGLVLAGWATTAQAERALTLNDALSLARQNNRDLVVARARLAEAHVGVEQAWANLLPNASATGSYTHNYKNAQLDLPSSFGFSGPVTILKEEQLQAALNVSVPLVAPSAYPGLTSAKQAYEAAQKNFDVSETTILFNAAQAFFTAAGADELLQARHHAVEVAQVTEQIAEARLEAGTVNRTEVTRAQLALLNAEQAVLTAQDTRDQAYRSLQTLLAVHEPIRVAPPAPEAEPLAETPLDQLRSQALHLRPEFGFYEANIKAADEQVSAAKWRWAPTLAAAGNLSGFNYAGFTGNDYSWAVGATLTWTIYDGGLRDASRHQAIAQRLENDAQLQLLHDTIADDLANSQQSLATRRKALATAIRSVALANETLDLLRAQYDAGTSTQLDVLQAQDSLISAEVSQAQARFDLSLADLTLQRVSGTFPKEGTSP